MDVRSDVQHYLSTAMPKSVVAVLKTKPETVREDYHRVMNLAGYRDVIDAEAADTALKVNLSSADFYLVGVDDAVASSMARSKRCSEGDGYDQRIASTFATSPQRDRHSTLAWANGRTSTSTSAPRTASRASTFAKARRGSTSATPWAT